MRGGCRTSPDSCAAAIPAFIVSAQLRLVPPAAAARCASTACAHQHKL